MTTAACLLGALLVTSAVPTLVVELGQPNGEIRPANSLSLSCGVTFILTCRAISATRVNWAVTAWVPNGQLAGMTTQRDVDAFPVGVGSEPWPAAYRTVVVQRATLGSQWIEARATRVDGCQSSMRVEVR